MKAEEFLNQHLTISHFYDDITDQMVVPSSQLEQAMVDFAKIHVKQALKEASEKVIMYDANDIDDPELDESGMAYEYYIVDKESILNAYPLNKIK
jgi:hypothetical protein